MVTSQRMLSHSYEHLDEVWGLPAMQEFAAHQIARLPLAIAPMNIYRTRQPKSLERPLCHPV